MSVSAVTTIANQEQEAPNNETAIKLLLLRMTLRDRKSLFILNRTKYQRQQLKKSEHYRQEKR
jgi:hypothetical protein